MTRLGGCEAPAETRLTAGIPSTPGDVPGAVGTAAEDAEGDAFGNQGRRASRRNRIADGLQLARHLARQHLDKTGAEHADSGARVGDVLQSDILACAYSPVDVVPTWVTEGTLRNGRGSTISSSTRGRAPQQ